ncbi:hypothetical protein L873DRAFT_792370 [Choiromyces venosus 120613-1]|uniref:Uncharacterized protein n=1 Tax=Choiromyces venosus 120613-1 TaxID=1336337 RepID=A0A3N4K7L4_9PEZI|nr:hypothetical protein L873DRAFT_792370 [Choiromyces venosus 120613-1]
MNKQCSYSLVSAKNASASGKFGEDSRQISAGGGILGNLKSIQTPWRQGVRILKKQANTHASLPRMPPQAPNLKTRKISAGGGILGRDE